jgi:general secretion pathway protein H
MAREAGFTLIEAVAVIAIVAMLAAIALPRIPHATSRPMLEAYAMEVAALLKADHVAALRRRIRVDTALNRSDRTVISGAGAGAVQLPPDVAFDAIVAENCNGRRNGDAIGFLPNGRSCGGVVALARPGAAYQVRVNWFTGGVDIVEADSPR